MSGFVGWAADGHAKMPNAFLEETGCFLQAFGLLAALDPLAKTLLGERDMHLCPKCLDGEITCAQWEFGRRICLECGEKIAQAEISLRRRSCMPLHKGNYVYVGSGDTGKQFVREISNMRRQQG